MQSENLNQSDSQENPDQWAACPQGEVGQLVSSLRQRRRHRRVIQGTVAVGVVMLLLTVGFSVSQILPQTADPLLQGQGSQYAGICCEKVQEHGKAYMAGTADKEISHRIEGHLKECKHCRTQFEKMKEMLNTTALLLPLEQFVLLQ